MGSITGRKILSYKKHRVSTGRKILSYKKHGVGNREEGNNIETRFSHGDTLIAHITDLAS